MYFFGLFKKKKKRDLTLQILKMTYFKISEQKKKSFKCYPEFLD